MMLITTLGQLNERKIKILGLVRGNSIARISLGGVRSPTITCAERMEEARETAIKKMIERASELGANAIVDVKFSTSALLPEFIELLAYGTAVEIKE
jgi:uncharacterized protein YbjQ (UPF0145 family)